MEIQHVDRARINVRHGRRLRLIEIDIIEGEIGDRLRPSRNGSSPPTFPGREFNLTNLGAISDDRSDCTSAFANAIITRNRVGEGTIIVAKGDFLTGDSPEENVRLYPSGGATVRFTHDLDEYPVVLTLWKASN